jgi:cytoskeletal protein CcmA (bactofilin family)
MKGFIATLAAALIFVPYLASAETVLRTGSDISVGTDQVINDDYYVSVGFQGTTDMSGEVAGDMLVLAGSAIVNGVVGEDLMALGGSLQMHGSTTDDLRVVAWDTVISESVGGDVVVLGSSLKVLPTATIGGNVYFFGVDAKIDGAVAGSVYGTAERVHINGTVGKDVDLHAAGGLMLGDKAVIDGNLSYQGFVPLARSQGTVVEGEVNEIVESEATDLREAAREMLTPLFVMLFAALSLFLLFKRGLQRLVEKIDESLLVATGLGAAAMFAGPVAAVLLLFTVLGFILGVALFGMFITLSSVAIALMGVVLGAFASKYARGRLEVTLATVVAGTVLLHLTLNVLAIVPVVGVVFVMSIFLVTLGGLTKSVYHVLHTRAE